LIYFLFIFFREDDCYWIGRQSLQSWRRLADEKYKELLRENGADDDPGEGTSNGVEKFEKSHLEKNGTNGDIDQPVNSSDSKKDYMDFNEDAMCIDHGML